MALKTFNLDEESYRKYSAHCKEHGISMSKQVDKFIAQEVAKVAKMPTSAVSESDLHTVRDLHKDPHSMIKYC
ncbi:MAG TPA: hypothetical protein VJK07_01670 [Candidatus Nanoarchaeia archaeon]|nr:hypothetical protein [Candidatus Nanoarchaeia archaeon]